MSHNQHESDLNIEKGSFLISSHKVIQFLRSGSSGGVCKCLDTRADEEAKQCWEIAILKHMQCLDPDICNIVKWDVLFPPGGAHLP